MPSADPRAPGGFGACVGRDDDPALRVWTPRGKPPASGRSSGPTLRNRPVGRRTGGPNACSCVLDCGNLSSIHDFIDVTLRRAWPGLDLDTAAPNVEFSR